MLGLDFWKESLTARVTDTHTRANIESSMIIILLQSVSFNDLNEKFTRDSKLDFIHIKRELQKKRGKKPQEHGDKTTFLVIAWRK